MNLNFNPKIKNLTVKTRLKTMIMGILLIAVATFSLIANNTIATAAFAQQPFQPFQTFSVKVTISKLPKQTADANTEVTLSQTGSNNDYHGEAGINIPGIGSGNVDVDYLFGSNVMSVTLTNIPGQTGPSENNISFKTPPKDISINIQGIGNGLLTMG